LEAGGSRDKEIVPRLGLLNWDKLDRKSSHERASFNISGFAEKEEILLMYILFSLLIPSGNTPSTDPAALILSISSLPQPLTGVCTISVSSDNATSAAASTVVSPGLSYIGATSTTSAPMTCKPVNPSSIVSNSRLDQPPGSDVPVAVTNNQSAIISIKYLAGRTSSTEIEDS